MAYLDYPGLSYFKSLLDETYLRTSYTGDTTIAGDVTFTGDTVFSKDITGNIDGKAKKDWRGQQIDGTYIKSISTNDNVGQIVYTKGDNTSNYIMIDMMQGATASAPGKAGLVPAPTISERTKFLRGDGEWGVPTDIYVTQNLINTNDSFPILIGATAGATESQIGTAIAFGTKVSVNPNTHALIADHLILKHPTYRRSNNVSSKVMYTLNFADSDDGNGNNLSEIYGYIDKPSEGGEHELGFRLFGNPNVQGVEEIFTYLSVGLSKTNIPYGHAPETPVPADHNEDTDIITRSYLKLNGSITGLVHTTMPETIDGTKTFVQKIVAQDGMNATGNIATDTLIVRQDATVGRDLAVTRNETVGGTLGVTGTSTLDGNVHMLHNLDVDGTANVDGASTLHGDVHMYNNLDVDKNANIDGNETIGGTLTTTGKLTANGTAEIKGGSGNTPSLKVTGNETVTGDLSVGGNETITGNETVTGNISTTNGNISTTNGTISGKTGSIGSGGLTVTGPSNLNGKITAGNGLDVTGNTETDTLTVNGNETVGGTLTSTGKITGNNGLKITGNTTTDSLTVNNNATVGGTTTMTGKLTANGGIDTTNINASGTATTQDLHVTDDATVDDKLSVGGNVTVDGSILKTVNNTTQEYVSYVTNQQETKTTIINNLIDPDQGLKLITKGSGANAKDYIAFKVGNGLTFHTANDSSGIKGQVDVDFSQLPPEQVKNIVDRMVDPDGAIIGSTQERIPAGETYHYYDNSGNLVSAVAPAGGIANPNYGKLTVDFSKLSRSQIEAIVLSMIAQDGQGHLTGGLATDANGKLIVDFGSMPTDTFEGMLQKLHLPVWVGEVNGESYVGTNFYVNFETGVNTTTNGRGRSEDKPWKTIAYATQTLAKNYNISNKEVVINVSGGTYTDPIALPLLQRTTGKVYIRPKTADDVVNIEWTCVSSGASTIHHSGGSWVIDNCNIKIILAEQTTPYYYYPHLVNSTDNTGGVSLRSCNFSFVDNTVPVDSTHGLCEARLICASSGNIQISNDGFYGDHSTAAGRTTTWSGTKTNANILWIHGEFGGNVTLWNGGQDYNLPYTYAVSGKWTRFANLLSKSQITSNGVGPHAVFSYNIAEIGRGSQGYYINSGASASTGTNSVEARENYFPRGYITTEGSDTPVSNYCDSSQFSYISPTS